MPDCAPLAPRRQSLVPKFTIAIHYAGDMRTIGITVVVAMLALAIPLHAQEEVRPDPLRGPHVDDVHARTLVGHSMTGDFLKIQGRPEAAAVLLLDLDDATLARARAIIDDRAMRVATLLIDELDLIREMTDEIRAGEAERARTLLERLHRACDPDRSRDPLLPALAAPLDDDQSAQLQSLLDEYWTAWVDWELRSMDNAPPDARRRTAPRHSGLPGRGPRRLRDLPAPIPRRARGHLRRRRPDARAARGDPVHRHRARQAHAT